MDMIHIHILLYMDMIQGLGSSALVGGGTDEAALLESPAVKMAGDASDDGSWVGPCIDVRDNGPGTKLHCSLV